MGEPLRDKNTIFVSGFLETGRVFLTSGFQPPYEGELGEQIKVSAEGQAYATGGSIQHIFLNEKLTNEEKIKLIDKIFKLPVNYITLTPTRSVCNSCSYSIVGEMKQCHQCGSKDILVYARIIGYVRPIVKGGEKGIIIDEEKGIYDGEENYWSDERRADWITRDKLDRSKKERLLKEIDELASII